MVAPITATPTPTTPILTICRRSSSLRYPPRRAGQCLGGGSGLPIAVVFRLVTDKTQQNFPLGSAWQVPPVGAYPLHPAGHGKTGGRLVHRRRPVIQIAPLLQWNDGGAVVKVVGLGCAVRGAGRYQSAVGKHRCPQVFPHPTLAADLHGVIDIALDIGDRGGVGAGLRVREQKCNRLRGVSFLRFVAAFHLHTVQHREPYVFRLVAGVKRIVGSAAGGFGL